MKQIELTQGYVALVDDGDYGLVNQHSWHVFPKPPYTNYASAKIRSEGEWVMLFMHRLIMVAPKGIGVDHINHDGLDNRRANLRLATSIQNQGNRRKLATTQSRFKGVSWRKDRGKWIARIQVNSTSQFLGYFDSEIEAATAYDNAALEHFREFAYTNFPLIKTVPQVPET